MSYTDYEQLPLVLSVADVIDVLKIGRNTAYDLIRSEKIRSIRIGHKIRIPKDSLLEFLHTTDN